MNPLVIFWIVVFVAMLLAEAATAGLVTLWFAGGALLAMIAAMCKVSVVWQIVIFVVSSSLLLALIYPKAKKKLKKIPVTPTNADRVIGMDGILTEAIDPIAGTGAVKVDGKVWTARSEAGKAIPEGTLVTVERIEGVRAIVAEKTSPDSE